MRVLLSILISLLAVVGAYPAVGPDSIAAHTAAVAPDTVASAGQRINPYRPDWRQLLVPGALIAAGTVGMEAGWFKGLNNHVPPGMSSGSGRSTPLDDMIQYVPLAGVYGLKLCGVKSRHDYLETTLLLAMSWTMSVITVQGAKHAFNVWRPDGTTHDSFPSGHSATAFMGAELMRMEFKDTNFWAGYAGYAVAVATGALRIHHDRHWLTDVLAGAGIGILSVRAAYWLYPLVTRHLFPALYRRNVCLSACGAPGEFALAVRININQ